MRKSKKPLNSAEIEAMFEDAKPVRQTKRQKRGQYVGKLRPPEPPNTVLPRRGERLDPKTVQTEDGELVLAPTKDDELVAEESGLDAETVQAYRRARELSEFEYRTLGIPKGLQGEEAEKFVDAELVALSPLAVGVLKHQLVYGKSQKERMEAARQVLESTGKGKREAVASSSPSIVIQLGGPGGLQLPWRSPTVNGEVVSAEPVQNKAQIAGGTGEKERP